MRLIFTISLCIAAVAVTSPVFGQTNGRKPSTEPKANVIPRAADPVAEFEKIVKKCLAGIEARSSAKVSVVPYGNVWVRRVSSDDVRYDVRKTESLVAPVVGTVDIQLLTGKGHAPTESGAKELTFTAESSESAIRARYKLNFVWRNDQWAYRDGTSTLDFRQDGRYQSLDMVHPVDLTKGRDYYGVVSQCFPEQ